MLVDDADDQALLLAGIGALGGDQGDAVLQVAHQIGGQLLRLLGDDLELQRGLRALDHRVAHRAVDEAVDDAADDRLKLEVVDKERDDRNRRVQHEADPGHV